VNENAQAYVGASHTSQLPKQDGSDLDRSQNILPHSFDVASQFMSDSIHEYLHFLRSRVSPNTLSRSPRSAPGTLQHPSGQAS
jgi:hypothetical protein